MPQSQNADARPIAFVLHDLARNKPQEVFQLTIRPEDLTRTEPSTGTVNQTLGGAWVDEGGPGIATLNLSGTTGWRGVSESRDGLKLFEELHALVFARWHKDRESAAKEGKNPDDVKLIFSDGLDGFSWVVKPEQFTLRRNKNRPLLSQYQINLTKLDEKVPEPSAKKGVSIEAAWKSLDASIRTINDFAANIKGRVASALGPMADGVKSLVNLTGKALADTRRLLAAGQNVVRSALDPVLGIARDLTKVSSNVFRIAASIKDLPQSIKQEFMQVGAAFVNAYCLLKNSLGRGGLLPNYTRLFGGSSCSSTSGGRPLSPYINTNVFPLLHPAAASPVSMSANAEKAIAQLGTVDVLKPPAPAAVAGLLHTITSGVSVASNVVDKAVSGLAAPFNTPGVSSGAI